MDSDVIQQTATCSFYVDGQAGVKHVVLNGQQDVFGDGEDVGVCWSAALASSRQRRGRDAWVPQWCLLPLPRTSCLLLLLSQALPGKNLQRRSHLHARLHRHFWTLLWADNRNRNRVWVRLPCEKGHLKRFQQVASQSLANISNTNTKPHLSTMTSHSVVHSGLFYILHRSTMRARKRSHQVQNFRPALGTEVCNSAFSDII